MICISNDFTRMSFSPKIRDICNNELILLPEQLGRPSQALGSNRRLVQVVLLRLAHRQRPGQQRLYLAPVGRQQVALEAARRVDQRAEKTAPFVKAPPLKAKLDQ